MFLFADRREAGALLAGRLRALALRDPLVLALPRGGVPVAVEIARALHAPLDVLIVRKLGAPGHEEFGIGAVTEEGHHFVDEESARLSGASASRIQATLERETLEARRRARLYRQGRPLPRVKDRSVVVVDDGLATGVTARAACRFVRERGAFEVILAVPVASPEAAALLRGEVSKLVCLEEPEPFYAVGEFYEIFNQVEDAEVLRLLSGRA